MGSIVYSNVPRLVFGCVTMVHKISSIFSRKGDVPLYQNEWFRKVEMIHLKETEPMIFRVIGNGVLNTDTTVSTSAVYKIEELNYIVVVTTRTEVFTFYKLEEVNK